MANPKQLPNELRTSLVLIRKSMQDYLRVLSVFRGEGAITDSQFNVGLDCLAETVKDVVLNDVPPKRGA